MPRQTLSAAFPDFQTRLAFSFPAPAAAPLLATASWRAGAVGSGGSRAPRRPLPPRYSPEPVGTSDGSGRGLAASRNPRGLAGSGPRGRGHVAGTSAPLAVASEHLSGRPQRKRAARRGRARRGGVGEAPSLAAPRCAERRALRASSPGPRARAPPAAPPTPPRALARARPHAARASPGGCGASSPECRLQGCWRLSPLFCDCFPGVGGWGGGRCWLSCQGGLTTQSDPNCESDAGPGAARGGCRAPSTAGCRRAGASSPHTRSCSAPGASCVTMDILALRRLLLALREAAAAAAVRQLRRRPGDQLGSGSSGGRSRHRRRHCRRSRWGEEEEEEGEKEGPAFTPEATYGLLPLAELLRAHDAGEATAILKLCGLVAPPERLAFQLFSEGNDQPPVD